MRKILKSTASQFAITVARPELKNFSRSFGKKLNGMISIQYLRDMGEPF